MDLKWAIAIKYVLEGMFFAGLAGCTITVLMSWVLVLRDAVSEDDPEAEKQS